MRNRVALTLSVACALVTTGIMAATGLTSGPQVGSSKILPFHPLNITGSAAGKKQCLV